MQSIFYNSDYVVVEYIDLIKSPYLILLNLIRKNPKLYDILNMDEIKYLNDGGLYEWYINRRNQNFFKDLSIFTCTGPQDKDWDDLLDDQISISERFYSDAPLLPLGGSLKFMKRQNVCKDIIVYHPHPNDFARSDLESSLGETFLWFNKWDDVMKTAGSDSTYFLSDITKLNLMKDAGVLEFSSVVIPQEYRYNKKNMSEYLIDYQELLKENTFKLAYILACKYE